MPAPISVVPPLILAAVLIVSAVAKLRHPDDIAGWSELGVPAPLRRPWLVRAHPWGELVLAVALVALGGVLGELAALAALALMAAYLWLVVSARNRNRDASCACFGERRQITVATVIRNSWLTVLALITVATIWTNPLVGGALVALTPEGWLWIGAIAMAVVTAILVMWSDGAGSAPVVESSTPVGSAAAPTEGSDEDLDYIRVRTPAVPVTLGNGGVVNLRELAASKPILILAVSPMCGSCDDVIGGVADWRPLLPEVDIRLLTTFAPGNPKTTELTEPQSLHDTHDYVRGSIADWQTPSAVLLGVDGMLAGGPVTGYAAIDKVVLDIYESLHGVRPEREVDSRPVIGARFAVVTLCTGNVHRSPLAAALLRQWALWYLPSDLAPAMSVASAGLAAAVGAPMDDRVLALARALGADGSAHRAAQVSDRLLSDADLVLVASRRQLEAVLSRVPSAVRRAFTIREAGRIAEGLGAEETPHSVRDLQRVVERLADSRAAAADADDDIIDPQGRGDEAYVQMAREEIPALAWLGVRMFGMPRADLTAYLSAAENPAGLLESTEASGPEA